MSEKVAGIRFVLFRFVVAAVELTAVRRHILGNCFATHRRQNEEKKCAWLVCCAVGAQTLNPFLYNASAGAKLGVSTAQYPAESMIHFCYRSSPGRTTSYTTILMGCW